jgi:hypothetical protein
MMEKAMKKVATIGRMIATAYRIPRVTIPYWPTKRSLATAHGIAALTHLTTKGLTCSPKTVFSRKSTATCAPKTPTNSYKA